jgi:hypothetical protein
MKRAIPDDLLTEEIRTVCKEQAREMIDDMFAFGVSEHTADRAMRGLVTKLIQQELLGKKRFTVVEVAKKAGVKLASRPRRKRPEGWESVDYPR